MIVRIREELFLNVTPVRSWLANLGIYEADHEYHFEYYGYEYNKAGDLQFYPIVHFKRDNMLTGPELTEFALRFS